MRKPGTGRDTLRFSDFIYFLRRTGALLFQSASPPEPKALGALNWSRGFLLLLLWPLLLLFQLSQWFGFLLDEIFFRGYRKVEVKAPVFVLGPPRSGTTSMHRALAGGAEGFTTFQTWELFLALSVTFRRLWLGLATLDRFIGRPFARLLNWAERKIFRGAEGIHPVSLRAPEEDYFTLVPLYACFILVLPLPFPALWRLTRFDESLPKTERERIMRFYKACLQKHLYVFGQQGQKRLLSKNAAFASWTGSLYETFPDCRVICCMREPHKTVPSLLSSVSSGMSFFRTATQPEARGIVRQRLVEAMLHYYEHLHAESGKRPANQFTFVYLQRFKADLTGEICRIFDQLELGALSQADLRRLEEQSRDARQYVSQHRYAAKTVGLDANDVAGKFAAVYAQHAFDPPGGQD